MHIHSSYAIFFLLRALSTYTSRQIAGTPPVTPRSTDQTQQTQTTSSQVTVDFIENLVVYWISCYSMYCLNIVRKCS